MVWRGKVLSPKPGHLSSSSIKKQERANSGKLSFDLKLIARTWVDTSLHTIKLAHKFYIFKKWPLSRNVRVNGLAGVWGWSEAEGTARVNDWRSRETFWSGGYTWLAVSQRGKGNKIASGQPGRIRDLETMYAWIMSWWKPLAWSFIHLSVP